MKDGVGEGGFMTSESTETKLASRRGSSDMNMLQVLAERAVDVREMWKTTFQTPWALTLRFVYTGYMPNNTND